jgi:hypothetical protein
MRNSDLTIRNCIFAFKCDAIWEEMISDLSEDYINSEDVRFCSKCQKEVFLSETDEALVKNVNLNRCVAIRRKESGITITELGNVI